MTMDTLYHYTSSYNFIKIIKSKSIWLSDLSLSNDSEEGKIVLKIVCSLLDETNLETYQREFIKNAVISIPTTYSCYGFCLSKKKDQLSQWRGYADDGSGFSIGFSRKFLNNITNICDENHPNNFHLLKVIYKPKKHEMAIRQILDKCIEKVPTLNSSGCDNRSEKIKKLLTVEIPFLSKMYLLKGKAFYEEAEWRLISIAKGFRHANYKTNFKAMNNGICPYIEVELVDYQDSVITDVYIGPKNITPKKIVENFLDQNGYKDVKVRVSKASYR